MFNPNPHPLPLDLDLDPRPFEALPALYFDDRPNNPAATPRVLWRPVPASATPAACRINSRRTYALVWPRHHPNRGGGFADDFFLGFGLGNDPYNGVGEGEFTPSYKTGQHRDRCVSISSEPTPGRRGRRACSYVLKD